MSDWRDIARAMTKEGLRALKSIRLFPRDVWTESDEGQTLFQLAHSGLCEHIRMNSTLGRFSITERGLAVTTAAEEREVFSECDCYPWVGPCPYCDS